MISGILSIKQQGQISEIDRSWLERNLAMLAPNKYEWKIVRYSAKRSVAQNRYWWACMTILGKELGYKPEEMHDICKMKFLLKKRNLVKNRETQKITLCQLSTDLQWVEVNTGEMFDYHDAEIIEDAVEIGHTSQLTKIEFVELTDKLREWSKSVLNIYLPLPDEMMELKFSK